MQYLSFLSITRQLLLWTLFTVLCFNYSYAQKAEIRGVVFDEGNGETIPLVNIIKMGTNIGTTSSENGEYSLHLKPGSHKIKFSNLAYQDTILTLKLEPGEVAIIDVYLREDQLLLDEIVVSADRVTRVVQKLAKARNSQNRGLKSYRANILKLAILGKNTGQDSLASSFNPMAYSERYAEVQHILKPERYSETLIANRSSKNFFSEYDFFSTGGPPLNLNQDLVPLSILSEDITVVGPISERAGRFYYLDETEAGEDWPEGTMEISLSPKMDNRPLFLGKIWYNPITSVILGVDVSLNEYASTNTGLFSISDLCYKQSYKQVDGFWLPDNTTLSARLKFMTSPEPIIYKDEWTWKNHQVNMNDLEVDDLDLNTMVIEPDAHLKKATFWNALEPSSDNSNYKYLTEAQSYKENNGAVRLSMSMMSRFFRLPYQLERFYLTNLSDIYHFNRVEGHTLGLGLRIPVHNEYDYRGIFGYGFSSEIFTYALGGYHYIPKTFFAPEFQVQKEVSLQYQDYDYNRTPLDFYEFRQTFGSLAFGRAENNYFLREGYSAGFRIRFDVESFIRLRYLNENHSTLSATTDFNITKSPIGEDFYRNNNPIYPALNGNLSGISFHLHHDTRKYLRTQFLRDYNIRDFGWLLDAKLEKGIDNWGSEFEYNRYRIAFKFNIPVFSSHFIQTDLIVGASDAGVPGQRLFNLNGFVVDDYIRERPFNTVSFKSPIGYRTSVAKVKYKFGSSITRKIPISFIQKSGIHLATFFTAGAIDNDKGLTPLIPSSQSTNQMEIGIAAFKIFGFMYVEYSRRLIGDFGNSMGLQILF